MAVDAQDRAVAVGAALAQLLPELREGAPLADHFSVVSSAGASSLHDAAPGADVRLRHRLLDLEIHGLLVADGQGRRTVHGRLVLAHPAQLEELGLDASAVDCGEVVVSGSAGVVASSPSPEPAGPGADAFDYARRVPDAIELPHSLLAAFAADLRAAAAEVREATGGDALRALGHRLAGSAGAYGYRELSDAFRSISRSAQQPGVDWRASRDHLDALCRSAAQAIDAGLARS